MDLIQKSYADIVTIPCLEGVKAQIMFATEKKIGLIPRLWVQGKWGPQEWALFVTDQRTILVLEKSSKAGLGGAFGAVGAAVAAAVPSKDRGFAFCPKDAYAAPS